MSTRRDPSFFCKGLPILFLDYTLADEIVPHCRAFWYFQIFASRNNAANDLEHVTQAQVYPQDKFLNELLKQRQWAFAILREISKLTGWQQSAFFSNVWKKSLSAIPQANENQDPERQGAAALLAILGWRTLRESQTPSLDWQRPVGQALTLLPSHASYFVPCPRTPGRQWTRRLHQGFSLSLCCGVWTKCILASQDGQAGKKHSHSTCLPWRPLNGNKWASNNNNKKVKNT